MSWCDPFLPRKATSAQQVTRDAARWRRQGRKKQRAIHTYTIEQAALSKTKCRPEESSKTTRTPRFSAFSFYFLRACEHHPPERIEVCRHSTASYSERTCRSMHSNEVEINTRHLFTGLLSTGSRISLLFCSLVQLHPYFKRPYLLACTYYHCPRIACLTSYIVCF